MITGQENKPETEWDKMDAKIKSLSDDDLKIIWQKLNDFDPRDIYAPGIYMDSWAEAIYFEINKRKLKGN